MRNKKLLSTVVATALAATMAMPVMAADGGQVDVDVDTRTAVIRVQVPTSLEVAVNQFEKGDDGSQIYSGNFEIANKSEIPVELTMDSELKMNANVKLAGTKAAAASSEETNGEAWLAVAAQTSAGKYIEAADKTIKDLSESDKNVTTFVQDGTTKTKATAQQVFYLDKAANVSTLTYTSFVPKEDAKADVAYAQFYKLTPVSFTAAADPDNPTSDETAKWQEELDAAIAAGNVYEIATTNDAAEGGKELTPTVEGATYASTNTYYSAEPTATAEADLKTAEKYVYTETASGGAAAFRYIGKLSESKATWTNTDFEKVTIKYTIVGATNTKYNAVKDNCTYGLYTPVTGPQITVSNSGLINITGLTADKNYKSIAITTPSGTFNIDDAPVTWDESKWSDSNGGDLSAQLGTEWMDDMKGASCKVVLTLSDNTPIEITVTIPA